MDNPEAQEAEPHEGPTELALSSVDDGQPPS